MLIDGLEVRRMALDKRLKVKTGPPPPPDVLQLMERILHSSMQVNSWKYGT